ncbi:hypothetical protein KY284_007156 [Solanum tuberosum]|nr:hypothetical protein KY284_007156 [Solanum tuberosum]
MAILMIAGVLATKGNEIEVWELFRGRLVNKQKDSSSKEKERQLHKLLKAIYDLNELPNRKLIQVTKKYPDGRLE